MTTVLQFMRGYGSTDKIKNDEHRIYYLAMRNMGGRWLSRAQRFEEADDKGRDEFIAATKFNATTRNKCRSVRLVLEATRLRLIGW